MKQKQSKLERDLHPKNNINIGSSVEQREKMLLSGLRRKLASKYLMVSAVVLSGAASFLFGPEIKTKTEAIINNPAPITMQIEEKDNQSLEKRLADISIRIPEAQASEREAMKIIYAKEIPLKAGDIFIQVRPMVGPEHPDYLLQTVITSLEVFGKAGGVFKPFCDIKTFHDTTYPTGYRTLFGHTEIILDDRDCQIPGGWDLLVMKPTALMKKITNPDEMIKKAVEVLSKPLSYNIPLVYTFVKLKQKGFLWENESLFFRENEAYGINFDTNLLKAAQYSPNLGTDIHYDIGHPKYWEKDRDCSGFVTGLIFYSYYKGEGGEPFRELLRDTSGGRALLDAVDSIPPGIMASWLESCGLAEFEPYIARNLQLPLLFNN